MRLFLLVLLLSLSLSCTSCLTPRGVKDIYSESSSAVYQLVYDGGHCTAFHIGDGYLVTASHCIVATDLTLITNENKIVVNKPILNRPAQDFAVIHVPEIRDHSYLVLGDNYKIGQQVVTIGFPGYINSKIVDVGHLIAVQRSFAGIMLIADGNVWPGESGGPLLDENGFVIGIASRLEVNDYEFPSGDKIVRITAIYISSEDLKKHLDSTYRQNLFPSLLD